MSDNNEEEVSFDISPDEMMPPVASRLWPEVVPTNAVSIITGLTSEGYEALYLLNSTNTPPWVIIGMLEVAMADVKRAWADGSLGYLSEHEETCEDESE